MIATEMRSGRLLLFLLAVAPRLALGQQTSPARIAGLDTLVLVANESSRFEATGFCVVLHPMISGGRVFASVQPEIFKRESTGSCGAIVHPRYGVFLGPDPLHQRLSVGPVSIPGSLAWLELSLDSLNNDLASISARIWTRPNQSIIARRRLLSQPQLRVIRTSLDTATIGAVFEWFEYGGVARATYALVSRGVPPVRVIADLLIEHIVIAGLKWTLENPPPSVFTVFDPTCGKTALLDIDKNGDGVFNGPDGCQRGVQIHVFGVRR